VVTPNGRLAWLLPLLLWGCGPTAFQRASKADTLEAWQAFVASHPQDPQLEDAQNRLAELELEEAQKAHTVVAYKRYLVAHPNGEGAARAGALLEALRFNTALEKDTAQAYRVFLHEHPEGAHREQIEQKLAQAELRELATTDDALLLRRAAGANPNDPRGELAGQRVDAAAWKQATSAAALYAYLRDFPAGAQRDAARVRLLSLQLEGLMASGLTAEAEAVARKNPLGEKVPELDRRLARARALEAVAASKRPEVQHALAAWSLRPFDELVRALQAPDALDRWQAVEELGHHVSVRALDPLLEVLRSARSPGARQRAFTALGRVLRALPREVAEYEVATRVEGLEATASDARALLTVAALLDLSGQLERAAAAYQKAFEPAAPDPVVLWRWAQLRADRRQLFSAAVAARGLLLWADGVVKEEPPATAASALSTARALCSAVEAAQFAVGVIAQAKAASTEFPDDVLEFARRGDEISRLAQARLRDAELVLLTASPAIRRCGDDAVEQRLAAGARDRLEALTRVLKNPKEKEGRLLSAYALERDPSPQVRDGVRALEAP
jgi:hypothetical protein